MAVKLPDDAQQEAEATGKLLKTYVQKAETASPELTPEGKGLDLEKLRQTVGPTHEAEQPLWPAAVSQLEREKQDQGEVHFPTPEKGSRMEAALAQAAQKGHDAPEAPEVDLDIDR